MLISRWPPRRLLWLAALLLFLGTGMAYLMVAHILRTTIFTVFVSYGAIVAGAFLGYLGVLHYLRPSRQRNHEDPFSRWFDADDHDEH